MKEIKLSSNEIMELCADFKALSDEGRLKIILLLLSGKKSVNAISESVGLSQSATSHQLRILKDARILKCERVGNENYYFLSDEHVKTVILTAVEHLGC
ncbi:MAG: winged helix-turn-helix transcriptional regulator [Clostridia bacterium]|nr:winged helix-turn-helix transcriptional regulator [Clostridia bacterium]